MGSYSITNTSQILSPTNLGIAISGAPVTINTTPATTPTTIGNLNGNITMFGRFIDISTTGGNTFGAVNIGRPNMTGGTNIEGGTNPMLINVYSPGQTNIGGRGAVNIGGAGQVNLGGTGGVRLGNLSSNTIIQGATVQRTLGTGGSTGIVQPVIQTQNFLTYTSTGVLQTIKFPTPYTTGTGTPTVIVQSNSSGFPDPVFGVFNIDPTGFDVTSNTAPSGSFFSYVAFGL
jgi:hypothetical protein